MRQHLGEAPVLHSSNAGCDAAGLVCFSLEGQGKPLGCPKVWIVDETETLLFVY